MDTIKILGFAGSLRQESYNKAILRAAAELAPPNVIFEIFDLDGLTVFNQDLEDNPTEKVKDFKNKIRSADALVIATPEYNHSMSGVIKNALDCASRPRQDNVFNDKPVAIMGASTGAIGTVRAQNHLRIACVTLNMHALNQPEVLVSFAQNKIDNQGRLFDEPTREIIAKMLQNLVEWTKRLRKVKDEVLL